MRQIVFIGSHLGFPMDRTPLGGGAMVGLQLVRHWAALQGGNGRAGFDLTVIGAGSEPPAPDVRYIQLPKGASPDLVRKSELGYARFCRDFERETTAFLKREKKNLDPSRTTVIVNDISESPDLEAVSALGYPIVSIWHVDVVEFFNRIYLGGWVSPQRLTSAFEGIDRLGFSALMPDVLRLVFQKQRQAVRHSRTLILPSRQMSKTIRRCYPGAGPRMVILPWGGWREEFPEREIEEEARRLREHYQLRPESRVLLTLSRISPEKGIHTLLEALRLLEKKGAVRNEDICLFVCGETAFMRGEAYGRKVRAAAEKLKHVRVFFPGYLSAFDKQVYFRLANLFVSPSLHESYGLTLVEAMSGGLPVLASDHYGVEEILDDAYGRIVSYQNARLRVRNLAAGLEGMLKDKPALSRMGGLAREAARGMSFSGSARKLLETAL